MPAPARQRARIFPGVASALATAAALALWGSCGGEWPPRGVVQSVRDGMGLAESAMGMGDGAGGADGPLWGRVSGFASVEDHASFKTISHEEVWLRLSRVD
ncbi:hypothetical protein T484DRAFT_1870877 [Baffinella frigidus]|nr:hypothetical protein T484DRAFT_1870877 [Cryptophyta sp. CCMP2293]